MNIYASSRAIKKHARQLLGNEYSPETEKALIKECYSGFVRSHRHISHDRAAHLDRIGAILHTFGTEGILLDSRGEDIGGGGSMSDVETDIQYCNAGDTYALTIMYVNGRLSIGDWGSIVEEKQV